MKFRDLSFLPLAVSCLCVAASAQNVSEAYAALNGNWQLTGAWADMSRPHHKEDKNDEAHVSLEVAQKMREFIVVLEERWGKEGHDISPESAKGTTNCLDETAGGSARPACRESEVNSRSKTRTQSMVLKGGVLFRAVQQSISPRIAVFKEIVSLFFN
jgi:hypothetical protein